MSEHHRTKAEHRSTSSRRPLPLVLTLTLAATLILAACGTVPDPEPEPDPLTIVGADEARVTQGSALTVRGSSIAGDARIDVGGVAALDLAVLDEAGAPVEAGVRDGVEIVVVVPVVELERDGVVTVSIRQPAPASDDEEETASLEVTYLVDGMLDEDFDVVFDFGSGAATLDGGADGDGVPAGLSIAWDYQSLYSVDIVADAWARNGKALRIAPDPDRIDETVDAFVAVLFDALGDDVGDVTVLVRMRDTAPSSGVPFPFMTGVGSRLSGTTGEAGAPRPFGNIYGQFVHFVDTGDVAAGDVRTFYVNDGAEGQFAAFPAVRGEYLLVRWTSDDTDRLVAFKTWSGTRFDEPADWNEEGIVVTFIENEERGSIGITRFFREHTSFIDWFAVTLPDQAE